MFATFEEAPFRRAESSLTAKDDNSGWSIYPQAGKSHNAIFAIDSETAGNDTTRLEVVLDFYHHVPALLGRFRISVCADDPEAIVRDQHQQQAATELTDPWSKLVGAYALHGRNDLAARYLGKALEADPPLSDDRAAQRRYHAARAAAKAATVRGKDQPPLDDATKAALRRQAHDWLTAELQAWTKLFDAGPAADRPDIATKLSAWQQHADLAGIRAAAALAKLPAEEQQQWRAAVGARAEADDLGCHLEGDRPEVALHHRAAGTGLAEVRL